MQPLETQKREDLFPYKGYKAYQPLNTYRAEVGLILHTEFRDGNVPAGYEQLRVFAHPKNAVTIHTPVRPGKAFAHSSSK
jgi:hypothetical protein